MSTALPVVLPEIPDGLILAAVSGGADSIAMLNMLHRSCDPKRHPLIVAHFHHGIRGAEADADAESVRKMAETLGLRFIFDRADIPQVAKQTGESEEMAARRLRHAFFQKTARAENCVAIATGHTADDQIETLFLRLSRGTSLRGAGGIRQLAGAPDAVPLIRPLLHLRHAEICAWLVAESILWREDSTNANVKIQRNRIRQCVVTAFEDAMGPQAVTSTLRSMSLFRDDNDFLDALAAEKFSACQNADGSLNVERLMAQPQPIFRRMIVAWLFDAGLETERVTLTAVSRIESLCSGSERGTLKATIGDGWEATRCNGLLKILRPSSDPDLVEVENSESLLICLPIADTVLGPLRIAAHTNGCYLHVSYSGSVQRPRRSSPLELPLACSISSTFQSRELVIRSPRAGDRISPAGSGITQKVSDILTNLKIPRDRRSNVLLLAEPEGRILWLPGYAVDETAAVKPGEMSIQLTLSSSPDVCA